MHACAHTYTYMRERESFYILAFIQELNATYRVLPPSYLPHNSNPVK